MVFELNLRLQVVLDLLGWSTHRKSREALSGSVAELGFLDAQPFRSPERKRGRAGVLGRTAVSSRTSLDDILFSSPVELAELLMDAGFLQETAACCWYVQVCAKANSTWEA